MDDERYLTDEEIIARGLGILFVDYADGKEKSWVQLTFDYIDAMENGDDGTAEDIRD
jgi:hypothetical protein